MPTRLAINCHSCVNAAAQWAGVAALNGPQDEPQKMMVAFDERRRFIVEALNKLPGVSCVDPAGAFYVFPNISKLGLTAKQLELKLLDEVGVATIAGTSFGVLWRGLSARSPTPTASRTSLSPCSGSANG